MLILVLFFIFKLLLMLSTFTALLGFCSIGLYLCMHMCEASRVGAITSSFNNKGNGTQDFSNSTIIINGGCRCNSLLNLQMQRFPPLVCASIAFGISLIWIGEAFMIGLGRGARVVVSGRRSLPFSGAYANHLFSLTPGSEAIIGNSFNNEGNGVQCFHNTTIIILGGGEAIIGNSFNNEGNGVQCFHDTTIIILV